MGHLNLSTLKNSKYPTIMKDDSNAHDQVIGVFFDREAKSMASRHKLKGIPRTAQRQVADIVESEAKLVVDVGSGPGSIMMSLLDNEVNFVVGVELSQTMLDIAEQRLSENENYTDRYKLINQNFLDLENQNFDAISLHRVLCCFPDTDAMLNKCVSLQPRIISVTTMRSWIPVRLFFGIFKFFAKRRGSFYPLAPTQKSIDNQMKENNYEVTGQSKNLFWIQSTYALNGNANDEM